MLTVTADSVQIMFDSHYVQVDWMTIAITLNIFLWASLLCQAIMISTLRSVLRRYAPTTVLVLDRLEHKVLTAFPIVYIAIVLSVCAKFIQVNLWP